MRYLSGINLVSFRGYKSFSFSGLKPITVVGGSNNSGKSSLLEAVCFLSNRASGMTPGKLTWNRGEKMKTRTFASLFYGGEDDGEIVIHGVFSDGTTRGVDLECTHRSAVEFGLEESNESLTEANAKLPPTYVQQYYTHLGDDKVSRGAMMIAFVRDEYRCYPLDPKNDRTEFRSVDGLKTEDDWQCAYYESQRRKDMSSVYSNLIRKGMEGGLVEVLKSVDRRVSLVTFDGERLLVGLERDGQMLRLPLGVMGDGMVKAAEILSLVWLSPENSILCIDEIENGLHHTVMAAFWKALVRVARERKLQIVATTHNLEMMRALSSDVVGDGRDFVFVNLTRSLSDDVVALGYSYEEYAAHLESGVEMR